MRRNYEIKVPVTNIKLAKWKTGSYIRKFDNRHHLVEMQKDIYYKVPGERMKLRIINNKSGNLIYYNRDEKDVKRISKYILAKAENPQELDEILRKFFKILVVVSKTRDIYIADNIRIHLDNVEGLGDFIEFEIVYNNLISAKKKMKELIDYYELDEKDFIKESYSDMLLKKQKRGHAINREKRHT